MLSHPERKWRLPRNSQFLLESQEDAFSSGIPKSHERDRNKPPDCKTETAAPSAKGNGGKIGKASKVSGAVDSTSRQEKAIANAARWFAENRETCQPVIPTIRDRFDLTPKEAVAAIRRANGRAG